MGVDGSYSPTAGTFIVIITAAISSRRTVLITTVFYAAQKLILHRCLFPGDRLPQ